MIVNCKVCGKETNKDKYSINKFGDNLYCSMACYHKKLKERFPEENGKCLQCGKTFKIHPSDKTYNRGKYCSKECKDIRQRGENHACSVPKVERVCKQCHKTFLIDKWRLTDMCRGQFCNRECKKQNMRNKPNLKYIKGVHSEEELTARTRQAIMHWKRAILKRDNYTCIWCGAIENLEVDHIKPYSMFVSLRTDINNGRTLCHKCHMKTPTYAKHLKELQSMNPDDMI